MNNITRTFDMHIDTSKPQACIKFTDKHRRDSSLEECVPEKNEPNLISLGTSLDYRMVLNRNQVAAPLPHLKAFVETGKITL